MSDIPQHRPDPPRLLITGTMNRADIVQMFASLIGYAEMCFLEYDRNWDTTVDERIYAPFGRLTRWESFASADELLTELDPDCVVFLAITALNQVALRQASARREIPAVHLEHGYRLPARDPGLHQAARGKDVWSERVRTLRHSTRTHQFFLRTAAARSSGPVRADLLKYAWRMAVGGASLDVQRAMAYLRRADHYVSYAPECFDFHRHHDRLSEIAEPPVTFVGAPQFDEFRDDPTSEADDTAVLLIDHQLHNAGLYGWSQSTHQAWVDEIHSVVAKQGMRLYVKTHPGDRSNAWARYATDHQVRVIDRSELVEVSRLVRTVLGTFSTLQLPLTGLSHTASVSLEIHPEPGWYPSRRLVDSGAVTPAHSFDDLRELLRDPGSLAERQRPAKADFIDRFLHRLDGRSGLRLRRAVLALAGGSDSAPATDPAPAGDEQRA